MPLKHSVEEIVLKNGARGLLVDIPDSTVVAYDVSFLAGNYYAPSLEVQQTAHLMEHMVFGATKNFPSVEAFSHEFAKNGAYSNATTYQFGMTYFADCAVMEWDRILDLQRQAITEPVFTDKLLKAEKGNVTDELTGYANNHGRVLWQAMQRALGDTSFIDAEKLETVQAVGVEDVIAHHKKTHTLKNMRFCIAGDLGKHRATFMQAFESWQLPEGERLAVPTSTFSSAEPVAIVRKDLPNVIFSLHITLNRKLTDDEETAMGAVNHILTGTFHSRIWGEARTRGICYGMGTGISSDIDGVSSWEISGQVQPRNAAELFQLIAEQLQKVAEGDISEEELDEAKQHALGAYQMRGQTVRAVNNWYSGYYFETGKIDPLTESPEHIKATTREQIVEMVSEFLKEGAWVVGAIGAEAELVAKEFDARIAPIVKTRG